MVSDPDSATFYLLVLRIPLWPLWWDLGTITDLILLGFIEMLNLKLLVIKCNIFSSFLFSVSSNQSAYSLLVEAKPKKRLENKMMP